MRRIRCGKRLITLRRSADEIEQSLSAMGYDKLPLKEILTVSFMNSLMDKEEMFVQRQQSANNQASNMRRVTDEIQKQGEDMRLGDNL
ncbi:MAG: hypothetical protein ABH879_10895 [archaeon]